MKSILYLVVKKQWHAYVTFISVLILTCLLIYGVQQKMNAVFKMPIAVQDMDESEASKTLIKALKSNKFVTIKRLEKDDAFIDDSIKSNVAVVSMSIPKGFQEKLAHQSLRDAIQLYYRDDFVGAIAQEITSKTLYDQQIPYIVTKHVNKYTKTDIYKVKQQYAKGTPESNIKQHAIAKHQDTSISLSMIFAMLLFVSLVQLLLHQRLKQNAALDRLYMFNHMKTLLHATYIAVHTILLMLAIIIIAYFIHQQMSFKFYLICFIFTVIYEFVLSVLLFKVDTVSHRLFMAVTFTLCLIILYLTAVTGGLL